jgi:hypothetical protein
MNYNATNKCAYKRSNTPIPEVEHVLSDEKKRRVKTTTSEDEMYSAYICVRCCYRKQPVVKKDPANPHYKCTRKCCPLPYHWNMCQTCINIQYHTVKVNDPTRKSEAEKFQRIFSKLPEDIQRLVGEYIPGLFSFIRESSKTLRYLKSFAIPHETYVHRPLCYETVEHLVNTRNIFAKFIDNPKEIWRLIYNELFLKVPSCAGLQKNAINICEKVNRLLQYICESHLSYIIKENDYWKFPTSAMNFHFEREVVAINRIIRILMKDDHHQNSPSR